jgi:hypothetical protein
VLCIEKSIEILISWSHHDRKQLFSLTRSALADSAGARTQLFTAVTLVVIVGVLYFLGPVYD